MQYELHTGNSLIELKKLKDNSVDSVITDPPYELGFMGKEWDKSGIANNVELWKEVLRVLKPGGHLLSFGGTRTYHRMVCAIEDAGFQIRDQIAWIYGSGFPKSNDIGKMIDKAAGATRIKTGDPRPVPNQAVVNQHFSKVDGDYCIKNSKIKCTDKRMEYYDTKPATAEAKIWNGWGTGLKPAMEPIVVARKPLSESTIIKNVIKYGTGAINIDASRIPTTDKFGGGKKGSSGFAAGYNDEGWEPGSDKGRWPANVITDGSDEVVAMFPDSNGAGGSIPKVKVTGYGNKNVGTGTYEYIPNHRISINSGSGSAARFFYCAKANKSDRDTGNTHPTVKPTELMRHLVRMVTPKGGLVLDPFLGSGSTGKACMLEGMRFIGIDLSPEYVKIATSRIEKAKAEYDDEHKIDEFVSD